MEASEVMDNEAFRKLVNKLADVMLDNISQQIDHNDRLAQALKAGFHNGMLVCWGQLRASVSTEQAAYMDTLVN